NAKTLDAYSQAIDAGQPALERGLRLSHDDEMVRDLIGQLMCHFELDIRAFEANWSVNLRSAFPTAWPRLAALSDDGLVRLSTDRIEVTDEGRYLIRNVAMVFDRYLPAQTTGFSKAI
ncbi:MAG TPA: coproporphyrinogen III oxidase, partial [Pseudomonadales bacterium]